MRPGGTSRSHLPRRHGALILWLSLPCLGCHGGDPEHRPDAFLRAQLGLTNDDRVHVVTLTGGAREHAFPDSIRVAPGTWVQFVTDDWRIHEVLFEPDSLGSEARAFLERTDQLASSPLVDRDSRFVVSFEGAPPGRYPYRLEGNAGPGRGVVVVDADDRR